VAAIQRRTFLKRILVIAGSAIAATLAAGRSRIARAAEWPRDAYAAETVEDALRNLYGTSQTQPSRAIRIHAPSRVENGAVVPISVTAVLPAVQTITILVDKNRQPLAAHVNLLDGIPYFFVNVKMASTSNVRAVVSAGGKLYSARRNVKVTVGG
jgi:sulfur-oxidizing protein SoxY